MVNNLVIIEPSVVPKTRSARPTRSSINTDIPKFVIPRSKTTTHQRSFLIRTTRVWNSLADELKLNMINLNSFKSTILSYYFVLCKFLTILKIHSKLYVPSVIPLELCFSLLSAAISYSFI